jgi:hypothetical protein
VSFVCQSIGEVPPPPLHATDYSTFTLYFKYFLNLKDTLYFLLKCILPPALFTLTQIVLLLITSTFTRVQIQSNLGTTALVGPLRKRIYNCMLFPHPTGYMILQSRHPHVLTGNICIYNMFAKQLII